MDPVSQQLFRATCCPGKGREEGNARKVSFTEMGELGWERRSKGGLPPGLATP